MTDAEKVAKHQFFLKNDPDWGFTPLMLAAANGHEEMCAMILSYGADAFIKSGLGRTARDMAAANGHDAVAKLLRLHMHYRQHPEDGDLNAVTSKSGGKKT